MCSPKNIPTALVQKQTKTIKKVAQILEREEREERDESVRKEMRGRGERRREGGGRG